MCVPCVLCYSNPHIGEVAEWSKALAWNASKGETPSRVRIPSSPQKYHALWAWYFCGDIMGPSPNSIFYQKYSSTVVENCSNMAFGDSPHTHSHTSYLPILILYTHTCLRALYHPCCFFNSDKPCVNFFDSTHFECLHALRNCLFLYLGK
jgi:hypothetical protein